MESASLQRFFETNPCAWWLETGSKSSRGRFLIHMDAQDAQDFFWRRLACSPGHPQIRTRSSPELASHAAASRPDYPVHPCSIFSPSRLIFPVAGVGCAQRPDSQSASRAAASGPINPVPLVAAQFPCDVAAGRPGWRRGPRLREVLCGRDARAPRAPSSHDTVRPTGQYCGSIGAPLVVEGSPSVFVLIRVHSWFVFTKRSAVFPRMIRTAGRGDG